MRFENLIDLTAELPFFDLATVVQLSGEERASVRTQLHRWMKAGRLFPLRRGMYSLSDRYRKVPISPAALANHLYRPSYLSGLWALGFYGLIPEKVEVFTSVSTRVPRRFENALGLFEYRHVKRDAFFAYREVSIQGSPVLLADPGKALLDLWHLESGEWNEPRMAGMRFQNLATVEANTLNRHAEAYNSPRLQRAVEAWYALAAREQDGRVEP